jgi:hypothetical protein
VEAHIQSVLDTLRHEGRGGIPRGELFISRTFLDHYFGSREATYTQKLAAAARSLGLSLVGIDLNHISTQPSPSREELRALAPFFTVGYVDGPVERLIEALGFAAAMKSLRKEPSLFSNLAASVLGEVEGAAETARRGGLSGLAIADDIAGNRGLLFSPDYFTEGVYPVYRDMARIIEKHGLSPLFHCDGDTRKIIGPLIEAGYRCIHPVDGGGGLDIYDLAAQFGDKVSFMGHIDIMAWEGTRIKAEKARAESSFAEGGLILGSMGGLSMDVKQDALFALYGDEGLSRISAMDV